MIAAKRLQVGLRLVAVLMVVVAGLVALSVSGVAQAQTNTANTLRVSPVRTDIVVNPGESRTVPTTITNLTAADITVRPTTNDFVASDESGTPSLILDETQFAPSHSLKRFMGPLQEVTVPANGAVTVDVVITVPANADAGGYFGAVRFSPTTPDGGGQVNLSASVASLILLTVPGEVTEKLTLTNFEAQQGGRTNSVFFDDKDLSVLTRFTSESGIQLGPVGKISVKKGDKVVYEVDFNNKNPRDMILPDSARRWNVPLEEVSGFGHYTVVSTFTYGSGNQTVEGETSFWVIPWFVIAIAAGGLIVLIGAIIGIVIFIKKQKSRTLRVKNRRGGLKL